MTVTELVPPPVAYATYASHCPPRVRQSSSTPGDANDP